MYLRADDIERGVAAAIDRWIANASLAAGDVLEAGAPGKIIDATHNALRDAAPDPDQKATASRIYFWAAHIQRIDIDQDWVRIKLDPRSLIKTPEADEHLIASVEVKTPIMMQRRGQERRIILGEIKEPLPTDPTIARLLGRAERWKDQWFKPEGPKLQSILAEAAAGVTDSHRTLRLAFLAPDIVAALLDGSAPVHLNAEALRRLDDLPASWQAQRKLLGFVRG